jgi:hypothetical protein
MVSGTVSAAGSAVADSRPHIAIYSVNLVPGAGIEPARCLRNPGFQAAPTAIDSGTKWLESPSSGVLSAIFFAAGTAQYPPLTLHPCQLPASTDAGVAPALPTIRPRQQYHGTSDESLLMSSLAANQHATRMSPDETCVCGSLLFRPELESGIRVSPNTDYICLDYVCLHCGRPYRWVGSPPELTLLVAADRRGDGDDAE